MSESQNSAILAYLEAGHSLTPIEALDLFGCFRLGARILELRKAGWQITTTPVRTPTGKWVAQYSMASERDRATRSLGLTIYAASP